MAMAGQGTGDMLLVDVLLPAVLHGRQQMRENQRNLEYWAGICAKTLVMQEWHNSLRGTWICGRADTYMMKPTDGQD
jgi:hypothetical protein